MIITVFSDVNYVLLERIRPGFAVESAERDSTPLQIVAALRVVLNLDVHDDRARLLNLADASQLHAIAEAGGDVASGSVGTQVARRNPGKEEEDQKAAGHDHQHQYGSNGKQSVGHPSIRGDNAGGFSARILRVGWFVGHRVPHLHQHKRDDRNQQESRKRKEKHAADGKHGRGQDHQKRKDGQHVMITSSLQRKQAHHLREQDEMNRGSKKAARQKEIVGEVDEDVDHSQQGGPALGDGIVAARQELVSADDKR